ncbi:MAG: tetratricopeptide repeat protein [Candidatus Eisenbacteria bacterium]|nr:tetratricopeptide repeat protein [Candidatus Eisenbacteria bacterium]
MASNSEILKKARDCERRGDFDGAAYEYRKLAESDPCPPIACNLLGDLYHRKGEPDDAYGWYQKAVDRYSQEGLFGNAIGVCRKMLRQYPHRIHAIEQLGALFFSQGLAREAVKHYMVYAARTAEIGDAEAVLRTGGRVREILAGDPEVRERLGEIFLALSLPDEGMVDLRAALQGYRDAGRIADGDRIATRLHELERSERTDPLSLLNEGEAHAPLDLVPPCAPSAFPPAGEEAFESLDHSRAEPAPRPIGREVLPRSSSLREGRPVRDEALRPVAPRPPVSEDEVELLPLERARPAPEPDMGPFAAPAPRDADFVPVEEILREFQNGVSKIIGKEDYQSHYDMGMSYKEMGLLEEALAEFEKSAASPELRSSSDEMRAAVLLDLGRYEECVRLLEGLLPLETEEGLGIRFLRGLAYERLGNEDRALREFRLVEERDPEFRDVRARIARMSA